MKIDMSAVDRWVDRLQEKGTGSEVRGYFGIGVENGKTRANIGTLLRSAHGLGAAFVFTAGERYKHQSSDTVKTWRHIPFWSFDDVGDFLLPQGCKLIGVELIDGVVSLPDFKHPQRAVYLLGAEDTGLSVKALSLCHAVIQIPAPSLNVAVAGSIVMYDRIVKG